MMTKQELEAKVKETEAKLARRQQYLLANDGDYRDLNAQLIIYREWLESLTEGD